MGPQLGARHAAYVISLIIAGTVGGPALAADGPVRIDTPAALASGVAAMPQIIGPANPAEWRINKALQLLNHNVLRAAKACHDGDWRRTVAVPMGGPGFLAVRVTDDVSCAGAAHPTAASWPIVYDLSTGRPVDWSHYLPSTLTGRISLATQIDGTRVVTFASTRLLDLYLSGYRPGATDKDTLSCRQALRDTESEGITAMMVWPDAKEGGLATEPTLPQALSACAEPVVIPSGALRNDGNAAPLLQALRKAGAVQPP